MDNVISPGIYNVGSLLSLLDLCNTPTTYNVSNGFTFIRLFGQFRWSSCNKLALFSDLSHSHLLVLLEPLLLFT